jgi:hypothetical protein
MILKTNLKWSLQETCIHLMFITVSHNSAQTDVPSRSMRTAEHDGTNLWMMVTFEIQAHIHIGKHQKLQPYYLTNAVSNLQV